MYLNEFCSLIGRDCFGIWQELFYLRHDMQPNLAQLFWITWLHFDSTSKSYISGKDKNPEPDCWWPTNYSVSLSVQRRAARGGGGDKRGQAASALIIAPHAKHIGPPFCLWAIASIYGLVKEPSKVAVTFWLFITVQVKQELFLPRQPPSSAHLSSCPSSFFHSHRHTARKEKD